MSGYACLHRSLIGHPAFRNDAEAMAFGYMVLRASWKPTRVRYKGKAITLARGQFAMSIRDLAEAMDRDKGWVERLLKRLKAETMCETRTETGVMVITICNYDKFQVKEAEAKTPRETPARQPQDTEQEGEELKKEETPPNPPAGGRRGKTRLPSDWRLPPISDLGPKARACAEQWTAACYETHGEAFVAYWSGNGKMMASWEATWANRVIALHSTVMRDQKFGNAPTGPSGTAPVVSMEAYNAAAARLAAKGFDANSGTRAEQPRNGATGPPRSVGALIPDLARMAGNA